MLDRIRFKGFDLEGSSLFINEDDNSDGGKYSLKFSDHHVVLSLIHISEPTRH